MKFEIKVQIWKRHEHIENWNLLVKDHYLSDKIAVYEKKLHTSDSCIYTCIMDGVYHLELQLCHVYSMRDPYNKFKIDYIKMVQVYYNIILQ